MKTRLDKLVHTQGIAESREKAKALIMCGQILVNNEKIDKPGTMVPEDSKIEFIGKKLRYVSRGGLKLEKAIAEYPIDLTDKVVLDIGASTGGFTDCSLQNGAKSVYAVDVGYGQLDWKLRTDERVINMERTNARYLTHEDFEKEIDFVTIDVAFISLEKILPAVDAILVKESAQVVALIKPQFEAGREKVGKKGVVRDFNVHEEVVERITEFAKNHNFVIKGLTFSPIKGPEGNIEYLLWLGRTGDHIEYDVQEVVGAAKELA